MHVQFRSGARQRKLPNTSMNKFSNLSIARKIAVAFGSIIGLYTLVLLIVGTQLFVGESGFSTYRGVARQSVIIGNVQATLLATRVAVKDFVISASETSISQVKDRAEQMASLNDKLLSLLTDDENAAGVGDIRAESVEMAAEMDEYIATFDKIVVAQRAIDSLAKSQLDVLGPFLVVQLKSVVEETRAAKAIEASRAADDALVSLAAMRLYANRLLVTASQQDFDAFAAAEDETEAHLTQLARVIQPDSSKAKVAKIAADAKKYLGAASDMKRLLDQRRVLLVDGLDVVGPKISESISQMQQSVKAYQDTIGPEISDRLQLGLILTVVISIVAVILGSVAATFIGRGIAGPIQAITRNVSSLSEDDLDIEIEGQGRKDEIGQVAAGLEVFRMKLVENKELQAQELVRVHEEKEREEEEKRQRILDEQEKAAQVEAERKRQAYVDGLIRDFDTSVSETLSVLENAGSELRETAGLMSSTAEETGTQSAVVAAAAQQTGAHVQAVATSAEELSASIQEISRQVASSSQLAQSAVQEGQSADEGITGLAEAASKIGAVVELINEIAEQTNLLALNATIEAARAGDAGKGFAVVASEVKALAQQTAKATDEISAQVLEIQTETEKAVTSILGINKTIASMSEISAMIAAAVEEQGAATNEIATTVQQTAAGTDDVTNNIQGVSEAAQTTGAAATQVLSSANQLVDQSAAMSTRISDFLVKIRAA
ncbi:methyl-accepting chemotaxis protein [Kordiimonas aestuarii]|uniref:methyl-accepting chemotaxis protein n=1 Tax=Kordiimonas aestuarii TaxID=1005925 RepID=UPI0021CFEC52|nr:HAMP domain-containing methyl-accepting chemotaxis protein [Kordiimonas aestuarii]